MVKTNTHPNSHHHSAVADKPIHNGVHRNSEHKNRAHSSKKKSPHSLHEIKGRWDAIKEKGVEFASNVRDKSVDVAHSLERNPKTRSYVNYIKNHRKEAILGGFLILGFIFSFYWLGSLIVGLGVGLYAPIGLKGMWSRLSGYVSAEGPLPSFALLIGAAFLLFNVMPFVVGAILGLGIKSILMDEFSAPAHRRGEHKK